MIDVGISTACLFPGNTEAVLEDMAERIFDNFEIFVNSDCELSDSFSEKISGILIQNHKKAISVHPFTSELEPSYFFSDYSRRFDDGCMYYQKYFKFAGKIGAKYVIIHGDQKNSRISVEEFGKRLMCLNLKAQAYHVEILLENVERCFSRDAEVITRLRNLYPELGYTLDVKQALKSSMDLYQMLEAMGNSLKHVHFSDHNSDNTCLPIGRGDMDIEEFATYLYTHHYCGVVLLELYGDDGEPIKVLADSYHKLKNIFNKYNRKKDV